MAMLPGQRLNRGAVISNVHVLSRRFLRQEYGGVVSCVRRAVLAPWRFSLCRHYGQQACPTSSVPIDVEGYVRATSLLAQLHANSIHRRNSLASWTGRIAPSDGSRRNLLFSFRLEDLELDMRERFDSLEILQVLFH